MLYQIISLLLDVAVGLVSGACLLRLYMQFQRIPMSARAGNPLGPFIFSLTDWIVLPLRKVLPTMGLVDTASLAAAFLLELAQFSILWLLQGAVQNMGVVVVLAVFGLVRIGLSTLTGLVLISALLSWVQTRSSMAEWLDRLVAPWLAPVRRVLPLFGGIDLSPLALLLALQIVALLLNALQGFAVMAVAV